jgi:putative CocE/NonD family hydrolase
VPSLHAIYYGRPMTGFHLALSLVVLSIPTIGVAQESSSSIPKKYTATRDVAVPMRDGVKLRADLLLPAGDERFPVLVYRTPYGKHNAEKDYTTFVHAAERGYAVVIQDVRGRYASEGEFVAYQQEGHDGYDTIEWAAAQSWSNGSVGTFGLSYPGAVQWLAAIENPPHLKAMVPAMTFSTPQNFFFAWGSWDMSWIDWIWNNIAPDIRLKKNLPGPKTSQDAADAWKDVAPVAYRELPLVGLKELQGVAPYYYEWLRHPLEDSWWDWCELRNKYGRVKAAVFNLSAWYDDNYGPEGASTNYAGLLKSRAGEAPHTHLLLGPWVHGVDSTANAQAGDRPFGAAAKIDYDETVLRWLDHYVRGIENGVEGEKPVRYFVMGHDEWREADSWPPPAKQNSFYLVSSHSESARTGRLLQSASDGSGYSSFESDPADPVTNLYKSSGAHDYRQLATRRDVLTFDSAPMERDLEVTGPIEAEVFFSCDCRDLDIWVHLLDVAPDGTAFNLMSPGLNVVRASYRDAQHGRQLLNLGQIYRLELPHLITSNVFQKGHRIRVQISASFFPNFSRNLQSGELESTSAKMQKATIRVYQERHYRSRLILPVVQH